MNEFDVLWRLKAVELAVMEQLEMEGGLTIGEKLFDRAKYIYDTGHEYGIENWESVWKEPEKKVEVKQDNPNFKVCPGCGELVRKGWNIHNYKSNGERCGYDFNKNNT